MDSGLEQQGGKRQDGAWQDISWQGNAPENVAWQGGEEYSKAADKKDGAKKTRRIKQPVFYGIIVAIVVAIIALVAAIIVVVTVENTKRVCEETTDPELVVECMSKDTLREEQLVYLRDKIKMVTVVSYSPEYIPEIISLYNQYFELLEMQKFPELYQDACVNISSRDLEKKYGETVVAYSRIYDDMLQTPDSAACTFNNLYYYGYKELADNYLSIMRERQLEEGFNPDQGGMG